MPGALAALLAATMAAVAVGGARITADGSGNMVIAAAERNVSIVASAVTINGADLLASMAAMQAGFQQTLGAMSAAIAEVAAQLREPSADQRAAVPTPVAARARNWRRLRDAVTGLEGDPAEVGRGGGKFMVGCGWWQNIAMEILAKQPAG